MARRKQDESAVATLEAPATVEAPALTHEPSKLGKLPGMPVKVKSVTDIVKQFLRDLQAHPDGKILSFYKQPEEPRISEQLAHVAPHLQEGLELRLRLVYRLG